MRYTFGPVPSRRLGLSLGVDIIPMKTCSLSCVYCEVGVTPSTTVTRRDYTPVGEILDELRTRLSANPAIEWITFTGSGEPTLHSGIGALIRGVKSFADLPVCVITNSTLMNDPGVRREIAAADLVMPSLDSAREESFRTVCRPDDLVTAADMIEGLVAFRKEYRGKIWLEVLFVAGMNDSPEDIAALKMAIARIEPDEVQINTVVRPPAEMDAEPLSAHRLAEIARELGEHAVVIASPKGTAPEGEIVDDDTVLAYLRRRPATMEDIVAALGIGKDNARELLESLEARGSVHRQEHFGKRYWDAIPAQDR